MLEQIIPVIGVPAEPAQAPKASLVTPRLVQPARIVSAEVENASKEANKAAKQKPTIPKQNENKVKVSNLSFPADLITTTGQPASQNGKYVNEEEKKLSTGEKAVLNAYVKHRIGPFKNQNLTPKQINKTQFKLRLVWLLNKKHFLGKHDEIVEAKKKATEAKIKAKRDLKAEKKMKAMQAQQLEAQDLEKHKQSSVVNAAKLTKPHMPNVSRPKSLMDIVVSHPPQETQPYFDDDFNRVSSSYQSQNESTGYQYLDDNWINGDKPWRSSQTSYAPTPDFTQYSNSDTYDSMNSYSSYPISSSTLSTSSYQMPTTSSYSLSTSLNYPLATDQSYTQQLSSASNFNTMPAEFNAPPLSFAQPPFPSVAPQPSFSSVAPVMNDNNNFNNLSDVNSVSSLTNSVQTDFVSSYRQEFPLQKQISLQDMNSTTAINQYGLQQQELQQTSQQSSFSAAPFDLTGTNVLEASEMELAKQRRLMEIEEELKMINFKKRQMEYEAQLREQEMQLAYRQQMMEYKEREIRDREMMHEHHRSSDREITSRDRYEDYEHSSRSSRHDGRSRSRPTRRSTEYYQQQQRNSTSSSTSRPIKIERKDDGDRRGGNEGRRGGEGSLKRPAESSGNRSDDSNRAGRIQPASVQPAAKKPRHRRSGRQGAHDDIQMQEISDED